MSQSTTAAVSGSRSWLALVLRDTSDTGKFRFRSTLFWFSLPLRKSFGNDEDEKMRMRMMMATCPPQSPSVAILHPSGLMVGTMCTWRMKMRTW